MRLTVRLTGQRKTGHAMLLEDLREFLNACDDNEIPEYTLVMARLMNDTEPVSIIALQVEKTSEGET